MILRNIQPTKIHHPHKVLRTSITSVGSFSEPRHRLSILFIIIILVSLALPISYFTGRSRYTNLQTGQLIFGFLIPLISRFLIPSPSLRHIFFNPVSVFIHFCQIILAKITSLIRSFSIPFNGLGFILRHTETIPVHDSKPTLPGTIPLLGRLHEPFKCLVIILRHPFSRIIRITQIHLSGSITAICCHSIPFHRLYRILRHPKSFLVYPSDHRRCPSIPGLRGLFIIGQSRGVILGIVIFISLCDPLARVALVPDHRLLLFPQQIHRGYGKITIF